MSTKRDVCVCSRSRRSLASHGHLTGADLYLARRCRWFRVHLLTPATLATGAGRVPYSRRPSRRLLMSRLKAAQIDSLCAATSSIEDRYGRLTLRPRRHGKQTRCVRQRYAIKRLLRSLNWRIFASSQTIGVKNEQALTIPPTGTRRLDNHVRKGYPVLCSCRTTSVEHATNQLKIM